MKLRKNLWVGILLFVFAVSMNGLTFGQINNEGEISIGEKITVSSRILKEDRKVWIYLPDHYKDSSKKYPVLYILDGYTYFISSIGVSKYLVDYDLAPEMIIVAIRNTNRSRDFTPSRTDYSSVSGGAANFLKFIREELFPYIDKNYRTQPYRIFAGHSLGGLCVFYALFYHPDMFDGYVAVSSSIWYDDQLVLKKAKEFLKEREDFNKSIYFSIEAGTGKHVLTNKSMAELLETYKGKNFQWKFKFMSDEGHISLWTRSFYEGLGFVSPWNLPGYIIAGGFDAVKKHFAEKGLEITGDVLGHFGFWYWRIEKNVKEAIRFLQARVKNFPSGEGYHSLGDAYRGNGQWDLAVEAWKKGIKVAEKKSDSALVTLLKEHIKAADKMREKK